MRLRARRHRRPLVGLDAAVTDLVPVPRPKMKTGSVRPPEPECPDADGHTVMRACPRCGWGVEESAKALERDSKARVAASFTPDHNVLYSSHFSEGLNARVYRADCTFCGWSMRLMENLAFHSGDLRRLQQEGDGHIEQMRNVEYQKQRLMLGCPHPRQIRPRAGGLIDLLPCTWCGF